MQDLFDEFPSVESAYIEAVNNAHDLSQWRPSHDVIYEAARRVGFRKLRRRDIGGGKKTFITMYREVCKAWQRGERFKREVIEPPKFRETLSEQELLQRRVVGRERLSDLRAMLGK